MGSIIKNQMVEATEIRKWTSITPKDLESDRLDQPNQVIRTPQ